MRKLSKIIFILSTIFILNGCDAQTLNDINNALGGTTNSTGSNSSGGKICMYNPTTQAMNWCHHKTAMGKCAHYGGPC